MYKNFADLPIHLTVKDIKNVFGIGQAQAYELVHSEGFPALKVGGTIRTPKDLLFAWIKEQAQAPIT
ncbi:MAG: helix-turn-helix domain-containing protein [Aminipila sp.]